MEKKVKKQSGFPLIAIVAVLIAAVVLFAWCTNSNPTGGANNLNHSTNTTPTPRPTPIPEVSQQGAQPPHMLGSPTATVTVEEFADFQCPSCGATYPVLHEVQGIYGSRIKFIFREFPLPMHDKAYDAAVAAEAAGMQSEDKFWAMHTQLYTNQKLWSVDPNYKQVFRGYAEKIGLDVDRWETDMAGLQAKNRVSQDMDRGKALEVGSTPTVFINRKSIAYADMNTQTLSKIIDDELKNAAAPQKSAAAPAANTNASAAAK